MISCPLATTRKMFLRVDWKPSMILDVFSHMTSWQEHGPANVISVMTSCGESMGLQRIFSDMTLYGKSMDLQRFSVTWHCMVKAWICKDFLWQFIVWRGHGPPKIFSNATSHGESMDLQTFSLTWHHGKSLDHAKNCQFQVFEEELEPRLVPSTKFKLWALCYCALPVTINWWEKKELILWKSSSNSNENIEWNGMQLELISI
jgi:hypothetical protein